MKKLVVTIALTLALPVSAQAADYVALTVSPTKVAPGWTLDATVTNGSFYRGDEIVGLTLRRSSRGGRAEEQHALRGHPKQTTISFDGRTGRWRVGSQLGSAATVDLAIEATGAPVTVEDAWGCGGGFAQLPVRLTGTLTLRTGTRFFGTIRKTRLTGFVTTDTGAVNCDRPGPTVCTPSSALQAGTAAGSVSVAPRNLVLQFRQAAGAAAWYHVMTVRGYDALSGSLPTLGVATPPAAIRGSARFAGQSATESSFGACRTTRTSGAATGSFATTFAGWGARTLRLAPGVPASFSESF